MIPRRLEQQVVAKGVAQCANTGILADRTGMPQWADLPLELLALVAHNLVPNRRTPRTSGDGLEPRQPAQQKANATATCASEKHMGSSGALSAMRASCSAWRAAATAIMCAVPRWLPLSEALRPPACWSTINHVAVLLPAEMLMEEPSPEKFVHLLEARLKQIFPGLHEVRRPCNTGLWSACCEFQALLPTSYTCFLPTGCGNQQ